MKKLLIALGLLGIAGACERPYPIEVPVNTDQLVVEAYIENNRPPLVILTRAVNYYDTLSPQKLSNLFVHDAVVTITEEDGTRHTLERITKDNFTPDLIPMLGAYINGDWLPFMLMSDSLAFYTIRGAALLGKSRHTYTLEIVHHGDTFRSRTTISDPPVIDSFSYRTDTVAETGRVLVSMYAHLIDPPGEDYYRIFTQTNQEPFYPHPGSSVFDDLSFDGRPLWTAFSRGFSRYDSFAFENFFFEPGDTVTLKICHIDRRVYTFYRNLEFHLRNRDNLNATPIYIPSNIENGRGVFAGYAAAYYTYIIPK